MFLVVGDILFTDDLLKFLNEKGYIHILSFDDLKQINIEKIKYIISRGAHFKYNKDLLEKFSNLESIFLFQIWVNNVDIDYCLNRWIEVKNFVSNKSVYAVAELTISSLIMWVRQALTLGCKLKNWNYQRNPLGFTLENKKIWVMWVWRIGSKVVDFLKKFPVNIGVYDIIFKDKRFDDLKNKFKQDWVQVFSNLDEFLKYSDYITIHIPGTETNKNLLWYNQLRNVKWVVNMSRAWLIKENDILKLINEWKLDFYVSDVVDWEPYFEKINKNLLKNDRVFILPHIWANTYEVQFDIINSFLNYVKQTKL